MAEVAVAWEYPAGQGREAAPHPGGPPVLSLEDFEGPLDFLLEMVRQQKLLAMIARSSRAGTVARAARDMAARALARADATGALPAIERDALRAVHDQLFN